MDNSKENFKKEFEAILTEAIEHFNPDVEDDASVIVVIADADNEQLVFGGHKLQEDLEGEGKWNEDSLVFYTAKSKYVKNCYKAINEDYDAWEQKISYNYEKLMISASEMSTLMGEAIGETTIDESLRKKLTGELLYCWCRAMEQTAEGDNFASYY